MLANTTVNIRSNLQAAKYIGRISPAAVDAMYEKLKDRTAERRYKCTRTKVARYLLVFQLSLAVLTKHQRVALENLYQRGSSR